MPRPRKDDLFGAVRRQVNQVLAVISHEIQRRENELKHLIHQADTWRAAIGGAGRSATARRTRVRRAGRVARPAKAGRPAHRVNWAEVLGSVPAQFGVSDVMKHPGARAKGRAQVYAALSRWLGDKKVKRVGFGKYEKASGAARPSVGQPKAPPKARRRRAKSAKRATPMKRAARRSTAKA